MDHASGFTPEMTLPVLPDEGYLPNQERDDDYRCFLVDWTGDVESYVTGFRAAPGNTNVGHHVVIYAVEPDLWPRFLELEEMEEGPGYTCFGGALPDELVGDRDRIDAYNERYPEGVRELADGNRWLAHWAPGMDGHVFPEGPGLRLAPGSGLVVQMHFTFAEPKVLSRDALDGASLTVRCTFENTTAETVYGGLGSGDEMCFNFSYISVRTDGGVATGGGG